MPPEHIFNPATAPDHAHKEYFLARDTADQVEDYIRASGLSTQTTNDLLLLLAEASGLELLRANLSVWQGMEQIADFGIRAILLEVKTAREDRERPEFDEAVKSIMKLHTLNISDACRDEYGRNMFFEQLEQVFRSWSHTTSDEQARVINMAPQQGSMLSKVPMIGGFFK
jgi:hypothetical protein